MNLNTQDENRVTATRKAALILSFSWGGGGDGAKFQALPVYYIIFNIFLRVLDYIKLVPECQILPLQFVCFNIL